MESHSTKDSIVVIILISVLLFTFGILNLNKGSLTQAQTGGGPYCTCTTCCPYGCQLSQCVDTNNDKCPDICKCGSQTECAISYTFCKRPSQISNLCCPRFAGGCATFDWTTNRCKYLGNTYPVQPCRSNPSCFGQRSQNCGGGR